MSAARRARSASSTWAAPAPNVVLTRVHLRYGKDALGDDLVFRPAQALVGGTGIPDEKGKLAGLTETGASVDTFQGRYVEGLPAEL